MARASEVRSLATVDGDDRLESNLPMNMRDAYSNLNQPVAELCKRDENNNESRAQKCQTDYII